MAATPQPAMKTSTPVIEKPDINLNTEKTSEVVPMMTAVADGGVYQDIDQCSLLQPAQLSRAPVIDRKKSTQLSAKRRLSYVEYSHEIPTIKPYHHGDNVAESKEIKDDLAHRTEQADYDTVSSNGSESIKASNHMQSSPNITPCKEITSLNSLKTVSPLTKAFKSPLAFHMQGSQPSLDLQQHSHSLSTATASPPVMIPSFSVPCLLSPSPHMHPMPQTFVLDTPPLHNLLSKSPSQVPCQTSLAGTNVGASLERNGDVPQNASTRTLMCQPSSSGMHNIMGTTSNVVHATPTTGNTNYSHSMMISDATSPSPVGCSKSDCGKSSDNVTLESMLRGHKHSADGMSSRGPNGHVRSQPSHSSGGQLKQALLQGSSLQSGMQQQTPSSFRCPRLIHCSNCGHKIDLKTYIGCSKQKTKIMPPAHTSIKSNVSNAGLTVFDLEVICDTGHIDQTLSVSTTGEQQEKQGSNTIKSSSCFNKPRYHCTGTTKPCFPHSDELTRSFAPLLSDNVSDCIEVAEGWGKFDTLDVDEMLQLLETTPEIRYCSSRNLRTEIADSKGYGKPQMNNEATLESLKPANHIVTQGHDLCYELHSSSGKTSQSGNFIRKTIGKLTRYHNPTTDCSNDSEKSDSSNSDGEVVLSCEDGGRVLRSRAKQPSSRICKKRPRKKQIKKASKKDKQKTTA